MSVSIVLATAGGRIGEIAGSRSRYAVSAGSERQRRAALGGLSEQVAEQSTTVHAVGWAPTVAAALFSGSRFAWRAGFEGQTGLGPVLLAFGVLANVAVTERDQLVGGNLRVAAGRV